MNGMKGLLINLPDEGWIFRTYVIDAMGGMKCTDYRLKVDDLPIQILCSEYFEVVHGETNYIKYKGRSHE